VVECAGPRYGTRLSGYTAPDHPGGKYLFPSSGPQVVGRTGLIALSTRVPVTEWWSEQGFGYGTRLTGHAGSRPPHGTYSRSSEPAPRLWSPPAFAQRS
jgi:hypothetical protein